MLEIAVRCEVEGFTLDVTARCDAFPLLLLGPSGSGKTTVLECLAGIREDVTGSVAWKDSVWLDTPAGRRVLPRDRGVGLVSQDSTLFPHQTVLENVEYGRRWRPADPTVGRPDPRALLAELQVEHLAGRPAGALSGGEIQRVSLARALAAGPRLLLLDEPFAHLDEETRERAQATLDGVLERHPVATVQVSHDRHELKRSAQTLWVLDRGRLAFSGPRETLRNGAKLSEFLAFMGKDE